MTVVCGSVTCLTSGKVHVVKRKIRHQVSRIKAGAGRIRNKSFYSNEEKVNKIISQLKVPGQKTVSHYNYNEMTVKRGKKKRPSDRSIKRLSTQGYTVKSKVSLCWHTVSDSC